MATVKRVQAPIRNPYQISIDPNKGANGLTLVNNGRVVGSGQPTIGDILGVSDPLGIEDFRADVARDLPGVLVGAAVLVVGAMLIFVGVNSFAQSSAVSAVKAAI